MQREITTAYSHQTNPTQLKKPFKLRLSSSATRTIMKQVKLISSLATMATVALSVLPALANPLPDFRNLKNPLDACQTNYLGTEKESLTVNQNTQEINRAVIGHNCDGVIEVIGKVTMNGEDNKTLYRIAREKQIAEFLQKVLLSY